MENSLVGKNYADLLILNYLKQHCNDTIVKSFTKGKKIDVKPEKATAVSLNEVLSSYQNCSKDKSKPTNVPPTNPKLITSTPKPFIAEKSNKSSSSDDSDDEADSDIDGQGKMDGSNGKKKQLTKTRKKSPGTNYFIIHKFTIR